MVKAPRSLDPTDARRGLGVAPTVEAVQLDGWREATRPVGLIRVRQVGPRTAAEVDRALDGWNRADLAGFVLDLRGSPGGRVEGAAQIAERFLPAGAVIYRWKDEAGRVTTRRVRRGRRPLAEPLVVLVDSSTASAAELLAGALAVHRRACLAGAPTYGKGRVERLEPPPGRNLAVARRPAGEYRLPDGSRVEGAGLLPDLLLYTPGEAAAWLASRGTDCRHGRHPKLELP